MDVDRQSPTSPARPPRTAGDEANRAAAPPAEGGGGGSGVDATSVRGDDHAGMNRPDAGPIQPGPAGTQTGRPTGVPVGGKASGPRAGGAALAQADPMRTIHLAAAIAACGAMPIGGAISSITLVVLAAITLLRLPKIRFECHPLLGVPTVIVGLLFLGWWATSLLWSPDLPMALKFLRTSRFFALVLMLWPVLDRVAVLVTATLVGVAVQNVLQIAGFLGALPPPRWEAWQANGGLSKHAGHMATWSAAAVLWHMAAIRLEPLRRWWRRGIPLLLAALGVAIGAGAAPLLGLLLGMLTLLVVIALRSTANGPKQWGPMVTCCIVVTIISTVALPTMRTKIDDAWLQIRTHRSAEPASTSVGQRLVWWEASLRAVPEAPWLGAGAGGFRTVAAADEFVLAAEMSRRDRTTVPFVYHDPHNSLLLAATELGVPGAMLLLLLTILMIVQCARDRWDHPTAAAALPILMLWFVAGTLESMQSSGILMAIGMFVLAITLPGRPARDSTVYPSPS